MTPSVNSWRAKGWVWWRGCCEVTYHKYLACCINKKDILDIDPGTCFFAFHDHDQLLSVGFQVESASGLTFVIVFDQATTAIVVTSHHHRHLLQ